MKHVVYILLVVAFLSHTRAAEILITDFSQGNASSADEAFAELISSSIPVVVKFTISPCGPCKDTEETFRSLAMTYKNKARFVKVDIRAHRSIGEKYSIEKVPAWGMFVEGKLFSEITTSSSKQTLKTFKSHIEAYMSSHKVPILD